MPVSRTTTVAQFVVPADPDVDRPLGRCVGERVAEQVGEDLGDAVGVGLDGDRRPAVHPERDALVDELGSQPFHAPRREVVEIDDPEVESDRTLLGAREIGQVGSEALEP